jgi:hypothetical protein
VYGTRSRLTAMATAVATQNNTMKELSMVIGRSDSVSVAVNLCDRTATAYGAPRISRATERATAIPLRSEAGLRSA